MVRHPSAVRAPWQVIVCLSALLSLHAHVALPDERLTPPPRVSETALGVNFQDGLLSIEVHDAAWPTVLWEVQRRTGVRLHLHLPLEGSVTTSFTDLPVEKALKRLFGPEVNFLFLYSAPPAAGLTPERPVAVWVIGRGWGDTAASREPREPGEIMPSAVEGAAPELGPELAREFDKDPRAAEAVALDAPSAEMRLAALAYLGQHAHPMAVDVLVAVVQDPDPHLRQSALDALLPRLDEDLSVPKT